MPTIPKLLRSPPKDLALALVILAGGLVVYKVIDLVMPTARTVPKKALTPERPVIRVRADGLGVEARKKLVTFHLMNTSGRPVTILKASTSCSCVAANDIEGKFVPPGQTIPAGFLVSLPEYGIVTTRIGIYHDGGPGPVDLSVEAEGLRSVPLFKDRLQVSMTFIDLQSSAEQADFTIRTIEAAGSKPWVESVRCDVKGTRIAALGMTEGGRDDANIVERTYRFRLAWEELPAVSNFRGSLICLTNDRSSPEKTIGRLLGTLHRRSPFAPTAIRLASGVKKADMILFDRGHGKWRIGKGFDPPPWLDLKWLVAENGQQALNVGLLAGAPSEAQSLDVPVSNEREEGVIRVVVSSE